MLKLLFQGQTRVYTLNHAIQIIVEYLLVQIIKLSIQSLVPQHSTNNNFMHSQDQ